MIGDYKTNDNATVIELGDKAVFSRAEVKALENELIAARKTIQEQQVQIDRRGRLDTADMQKTEIEVKAYAITAPEATMTVLCLPDNCQPDYLIGRGHNVVPLVSKVDHDAQEAKLEAIYHAVSSFDGQYAATLGDEILNIIDGKKEPGA